MKMFKFIIKFFRRPVPTQTVFSSSLTFIGTILIMGLFTGYISYKTSDYVEIDTSNLPPQDVQTIKTYRTIYYVSFFATCVFGSAAILWLVGYYSDAFAEQIIIRITSCDQFTSQLSKACHISVKEIWTTLSNVFSTPAAANPNLCSITFSAYFPDDLVKTFYPNGIPPETQRAALGVLYRCITSTEFLNNSFTPAAKNFFMGQHTPANRVCAMIITLLKDYI